MNTEMTPSPDLVQRYRTAEVISQMLANGKALNGQVVPRWIPDTDQFWYEHEREDGLEIRWVDAQKQTNLPAFDHETLARMLAAAMPDEKSEISPWKLPLNKLAVEAERAAIRFEAFGKIWRYDTAQDRLESAGVAQKASPGAMSPDEKYTAFLRDFNLWVRETETGLERAITQDGVKFFGYGTPTHARAGLVPKEGESSMPQLVWSADSKRLLTIRIDDRLVRPHILVDHAPADGTVHPRHQEVRFAVPGDQHVPEAGIYAVHVDTGKLVRARYPGVPVVRMLDALIDAGLVWFGAGSETGYFVDVERGEKKAHVIAFDTATGDCRQVFSEVADNYLELGSNVYTRSNVYALPASGQVIWPSERTGQMHLYLYDLATGLLKNTITEGSWRVRDVVKVDEARGMVYYTASGWPGRPNPYERVLCRSSVEGGEAQLLTAEPGDHDVIGVSDFSLMALALSGVQVSAVGGISPSTNYLVDTVGTIAAAPVSVLRDAQGRQLMELATGTVSGMPNGWRWPETFEATAADGSTLLHGVLLKPSDFDPARRYPVIDFIYGGPQVAHVPQGYMRNVLERAAICEAQSHAELGFVVVIIDGRGTAMRDRAFHEHSCKAVHRASDIDDHVAAIQQLAQRHEFIDLQRVGITGFSGGGFATAHAMLSRPDFFKVGVASSGNYDQRLFWHGWGERYHGLVDGKNYESQSLIGLADRLEGRLMFTHGLLDPGCPVSALFQLTQALSEANKDFDLVLDPRLGHERSSYATRRAWDFFVRHLGGMQPPAGIAIKTGGEVMKESMIKRMASNA